MNRFRILVTITLFVSALAFGACSQDETMDELMGDTQLNKPVLADDTTGNGKEEDEDKP